eukprot:717414-Amphidinium_carterae.2
MNDKPLVNGLFGVPKPGEFVDVAGQELPMLRLIMNLTASKSIMGDVPADIATLPRMTQWRTICLADGVGLCVSGEDLKRCLLNCPAFWLEPVFVFNMPLCADDLGIPGGCARRWVAARVVPMGWKGALGLVQFLHRRMLLHASLFLGPFQSVPGLDVLREWHAECHGDRSMPWVRKEVDWQHMWQGCLSLVGCTAIRREGYLQAVVGCSAWDASRWQFRTVRAHCGKIGATSAINSTAAIDDALLRCATIAIERLASTFGALDSCYGVPAGDNVMSQ